MDDNRAQPPERTPEELAWDEEFRTEPEPGFASDLANLAKFAVRLPGAIMESVVPEETARHLRAAAREGFLALRSLLGAVGDGIEEMLAEPQPKGATVQGPAGTWGTSRSAQPPASSGKARRIEVSDEDG